MRFDKIILVGANKVACDCLNIICKEVDSKAVHVLETSDDRISMLSKICQKNNASYFRCTDKEQITSYLENETECLNTFIVSANNRYIFKQSLISKSNVEIVNFHYALLPNYRGINIPSWVIYNGEKETGVTWHYVTEEIDHGSILSQKRIPISDSTTAYDITKEGMKLAAVGFSEFFPEILYKEIKGIDVEYPKDEKPYLSKNLPNNGYIDVNDNIDLVDRTLRAYDYNRMNLLPKLKLKDGDNYYTVSSYKIEQDDQDAPQTMRLNPNDIYIYIYWQLQACINCCFVGKIKCLHHRKNSVFIDGRFFDEL